MSCAGAERWASCKVVRLLLHSRRLTGLGVLLGQDGAGMEMVAVQTSVRSIAEKYRVVELSTLREDMTEVNLTDALVSKHPRYELI